MRIIPHGLLDTAVRILLDIMESAGDRRPGDRRPRLVALAISRPLSFAYYDQLVVTRGFR